MSPPSYQLARQTEDAGELTPSDSDSPRELEPDAVQEQQLLQHLHDQQLLSPVETGSTDVNNSRQVSTHQHGARPRLLTLLLCAALGAACTLLIRPFFADDSADSLLVDYYGNVLSMADVSRACLNGSYTEGEWWYDAEARYPLWNFNASELLLHNISFPLRPELLNSSLLFVRPALKYVWRPTHCRLQPFPLHDPLQFCRALQGRPLLFVGDSIAYQHYQSLTFMLGDRSRDEQFPGGESRICNELLDRDALQQVRRRCEQGGTSLVLSTGQRAEFGSNCLSGRWLGRLPAALNASTMIRFRRNDHISFVEKDLWTTPGGRTGMRHRNALHTLPSPSG
jgi:hypothetical protein